MGTTRRAFVLGGAALAATAGASSAHQAMLWMSAPRPGMGPLAAIPVLASVHYCGHLGKKANCQSLVSLTLARGEVPVPVGLHLFLPEEWVTSSSRKNSAWITSWDGPGPGCIATR